MVTARKAGTHLDEIVAARRKQVQEAQARVPLDALRREAEARADRRDFAAALAAEGFHVIAEMKRASPSRGLLCPRYRRRDIAQGYEAAGASALSVLTEPRFFLGALEDLQEARAAVQIPVLRKDFILGPYQVYESVAVGADALLLIVAALSDAELQDLIELCRHLKIAALVEVHTEDELERARAAGASILGVNNRDLKTLAVDLQTSFRLREKIPAGLTTVSESGIRTPADLRKLAEAGYYAALVGERLMTQPDPGKALAALREGLPASTAPRR